MLFLVFNSKYHNLSDYPDSLFILNNKYDYEDIKIFDYIEMNGINIEEYNIYITEINKNREEIIREFKYFMKGGYSYFS